MAVALYLKTTCILFAPQVNNCLVYDKNWPEIENLNMKEEKCIYLYRSNYEEGILKSVKISEDLLKKNTNDSSKQIETENESDESVVEIKKESMKVGETSRKLRSKKQKLKDNIEIIELDDSD